MASPRISRIIGEFNAYINYTTNYLLEETENASGTMTPNWERVGLTAQEKNQWVAFRNENNTQYALYANKKETRTTAVKDKFRTNQRDFIAFAQPLLNRIAYGPEVTIDDLEVFNIKAGPLFDNTRTRITTPIEESVTFTMQPIGGGQLKFTCQSVSDSSRASKLPGTDIEMRYLVLPSEAPAPASVGELTDDKISSRAIFVLSAGTEFQGYRIYAACRWIVINNQDRNGPWSGIATVVVA